MSIADSIHAVTYSPNIRHSSPGLFPAVSPAACGLSGHLFSSSVAQNEVLFSSDGLTLVSLDRLYSLKSALSSYSKTRSLLRLEDAVDELRRYVLASGGAKVTQADLLRSYDWLGVSAAAVADLDRMYRRAYGGAECVGAVSGMSPSPPPKPIARSSEDDYFQGNEGGGAGSPRNWPRLDSDDGAEQTAFATGTAPPAANHVQHETATG